MKKHKHKLERIVRVAMLILLGIYGIILIIGGYEPSNSLIYCMLVLLLAYHVPNEHKEDVRCKRMIYDRTTDYGLKAITASSEDEFWEYIKRRDAKIFGECIEPSHIASTYDLYKIWAGEQKDSQPES